MTPIKSLLPRHDAVPCFLCRLWALVVPRSGIAADRLPSRCLFSRGWSGGRFPEVTVARAPDPRPCRFSGTRLSLPDCLGPSLAMAQSAGFPLVRRPPQAALAVRSAPFFFAPVFSVFTPLLLARACLAVDPRRSRHGPVAVALVSCRLPRGFGRNRPPPPRRFRRSMPGHPSTRLFFDRIVDTAFRSDFSLQRIILSADGRRKFLRRWAPRSS